MCGAPVVLNMLSNSPDNEPLKNPVNILPVGDPPPAAVLPRTEYLGFVVSHGYGLTETAGLGVSCAWKPEWKARQVVRLAGMTRIDVLDPNTGKSMKRDGSTLVEIVLRGPERSDWNGDVHEGRVEI
ncbi:probable acyl-activating enzyme 5, peroxisomal [Ziziphus jujuba]|uniref:Probable acyl-activating enzyme 5, peroxisomal n=1 Tax=Ziziphus jujuba TaxID=326968 RepID=A0A6P4AG23_ZIZJJ|nr:probable acyl-activating enzyme 5, peroxisomal [Ziziphus jujuba]